MSNAPYIEIKDQKIRTKIRDLMSDMLDNPTQVGIYPTSEFMSKMEDFVLETRTEAIGWAWAEACTQLDKGKNPREHDQAELLIDSKRDLG